MNNDNNPFKAPAARVADLAPEAGSFIAEGRRVPAGNGVAWLSAGWSQFRQAPGPWIAVSLGFLAIMVVLALVPLVNVLANLLLPIFVGGLMLGCRSLEEGGELRFGHLFAGFSGHAGSLVLVGLLYLAGMILVMVIAGLLGAGLGLGIGAVAGGHDAGAAMILGILVIGLVAVVLMLPLVMAVWYAPALVVFHEVAPFQAMKSSFSVCLKNFLPFLVYGLVFLVLAVVASLPLLLGWLLLLPVTYGSIYASYQDMFTDR